jgi:hypothetical protein
VRVDRLGPAHRLDDGELAEGVVEMVVASDDVGHSHVVIVDHDREHVGGAAVGAEQDHVVQLAILDDDPALDRIVDRGLALARRLEADHERGVGSRGVRGAVAPRAGEAEGTALALRLGAGGGELGLAHVAAIGVAAGEHFVGDLGVARLELRLVIFVAVPVEAEPFQAVQYDVDRLLGRPRRVGVLDPQQGAPAMVAGVEPAEQAGAGIADMEEAGRRGRKAGDDLWLGGCAQALFLQGCGRGRR